MSAPSRFQGRGEAVSRKSTLPFVGRVRVSRLQFARVGPGVRVWWRNTKGSPRYLRAALGQHAAAYAAHYIVHLLCRQLAILSLVANAKQLQILCRFKFCAKGLILEYLGNSSRLGIVCISLMDAQGLPRRGGK